jgi:hypothetical protein
MVAGVVSGNWVKVPVSVTAPLVGARHTAVPFVEFEALLIWMAVGSGFDHVPNERASHCGTGQLGGVAVGYAVPTN